MELAVIIISDLLVQTDRLQQIANTPHVSFLFSCHCHFLSSLACVQLGPPSSYESWLVQFGTRLPTYAVHIVCVWVGVCMSVCLYVCMSVWWVSVCLCLLRVPVHVSSKLNTQGDGLHSDWMRPRLTR